MRQVLVRKGKIDVREVPAPGISPGCILIRVVASCISPGTELVTVRSSGETLGQRVHSRPELIGKGLEMLARDGIVGTWRRIQEKLDAAHPLGYSVAGLVVGIGQGVHGYTLGQQVAAAGLGQANHAEYANVPANLVVPVPPGIPLDHAATVALGSIALHGVRRAELQLGDVVAVVGLGAIGQLTLQLAHAAGARVIGLDPDPERLAIAEHHGAEHTINPKHEDARAIVPALSNGQGADAVIFTAATEDPAVLRQALSLCRQRGRLVMVGTYGKEVHRDDLYAKEIDFRIATSYGPGRYDERYEAQGHDYPYAHVRWTENRNMAEYLRLLSSGSVKVSGLIADRIPAARAAEAFDALANRQPRPLIITLEHASPTEGEPPLPMPIPMPPPAPAIRAVSDKLLRVGLIGTGGFASGVHLPNLARMSDRFRVDAIASRTGSNADTHARHCGARYATTNWRQVVDDPEIDLVFICTRHHLHAEQVLAALAVGKHVFVEKPLCLTRDELTRIEAFYAGRDADVPLLMVGYNRRFSPWIQAIAKPVRQRTTPFVARYRMNVPPLPASHWIQGPEGGGRLIGEACHIVDLFLYLAHCPLRDTTLHRLAGPATANTPDDTFTLTLEFADGSLASLDYFTVGARNLPKEQIELHLAGTTCILDDYATLRALGTSLATKPAWKGDKGHRAELDALHHGITNQHWPIPLQDLLMSSRITLAANADSLSADTID